MRYRNATDGGEGRGGGAKKGHSPYYPRFEKWVNRFLTLPPLRALPSSVLFRRGVRETGTLREGKWNEDRGEPNGSPLPPHCLYPGRNFRVKIHGKRAALRHIVNGIGTSCAL